VRVLHVASEVAPFAQSGGLADVVAGLPAAQAAMPDLAVAVLVPMYRGVAERVASAGATLDEGALLTLTVGPHTIVATLRRAMVNGVMHGFLDCPALYDRPGGLYGPGGAGEWHDNHLRFGALGKAALGAGALLLGGRPDVLHVHDWQGGPAAIYARLGEAPPVIVTTIHNLAYRGIFPKSVMTDLGIPWSVFTTKLVEFWDQVSFLKGALAMSDAVTTVSPSYAQEILTPAFGEALDGFLVHDIERIVGIVNGIDTHAWDPATDTTLPARFSVDSPAGKATCKRALATEIGMPLPANEPMIGVIARMTGQKGLDLVADIAPELHRIGARLVVLGAGEPELEARFTYLATTFTENVFTRIGFDIGLARRIYASSDLFVMPSRFEPCGLGQLYAMRYGAIPIVHAVGGLRDTVIDPGDAELSRGHGTGITFEAATAPALLAAIERGVALHRDRAAFAALRRSAMSRDSSWSASAKDYVQLYGSRRT
jgi:starch synthase